MSETISITAAEPRQDYELRITFSDGAIKEVDLGAMISDARGVLRALSDPEFFRQLRVNPETGTIEWPGEIDLDPEVLYGNFEPASSAPIERRTVRQPLKSPG
jgi:hypothetical protein